MVAVAVGAGLMIRFDGGDDPVREPLAGETVGMANADARTPGLVDDEAQPVLQVEIDPSSAEAMADAPAQGDAEAAAQGEPDEPVSAEADATTSAPPTTTVSTTMPVVDPTTSSTAPQSSETSTPVAPPGLPPVVDSPQAAAALIGQAPGPEYLNDVEWQILQMTNELRTNPNGPLRRQGPIIDCDGRIELDPNTGLYLPGPALEPHREASLVVARPWSSQMSTTLQHREEAGIPVFQEAGIMVRAAGENIAYHNFPDRAYHHFTGWRESDGHFCNMMDPSFTHIGVGEVTKVDGFSYATQNLFSFQPDAG